MKTCNTLLLFVAFFCSGNKLFASHSLSADIAYTYLGDLTFSITVTYYMDIGTPADREWIALMYSDGTFDTIDRVSQEFLPDDISKNVYTTEHTFTVLAPITVSMSDPNFIDDIINVDGSVNVPIVVETVIDIPAIAWLGTNASPVFYDVPVDYAEIGEVFTHAADFFDADGDELKFYFVDAELPGYVFPNVVIPCDVATFSIDESTGLITWDHPCSPGIYIAKIKIEEWRAGIQITTIYRYFLIKVDDTGATGINDEIKGLINIYPNPSDGNFTIDVPSQSDMLTIYNIHGDMIKTLHCEDAGGKLTINTTGLAPGYYMVSIWIDGNKTTTTISINQ